MPVSMTRVGATGNSGFCEQLDAMGQSGNELPLGPESQNSDVGATRRRRQAPRDEFQGLAPLATACRRYAAEEWDEKRVR